MDPKARDSLDALQSLINDVLVQTGKALRASRRDAQGNLTQAPGTMQSKLPDTINTFHNALDDIEFDIIRAKSALLRDLNEVWDKKKKLLAQSAPQPVEPQSKQLMTIDLDSSPTMGIKDEPMVDDVPMKPMAPFPNMSIDLADSNPMDITMNDPNSQPQPPPPGGMDGLNSKANAGIPSGPIAQMSIPDRKPPADMKLDISGSNHTSGLTDTSGMNFTDMEFTLAPPANAEPQGTNEPSFDLTTFAPTDGGDDMLNLNNLLPPTDQPGPSSSSGPATQGATSNIQEKVEETKGQPADSTINNGYFSNDSGAADGMDFDFSLGADDTFDDLMNNRDSTFELMDAGGDFDTAFFGLDKTDET